MKPLCIYHGNCADGFGSAWVVRQAFGEGNVDFYPGVYQRPPPDVFKREVILVDFSYKRDVLLEMAKRAKSILVIDHHKSAIEDLQQGVWPDNTQFIFDINHSGVMLTWLHYFGSVSTILRPLLVDHLEDRDLWRFKLEGTEEIQATVFSYPYVFEIWDKLMAAPTSELRKEGEAILRKHHKDVAELTTAFQYWQMIGGVVVPVASLPYTLTSDAGHLMAEKFAPKAFAACYYDTPDGRNFSLRSLDEGMDVSQIAKSYGGGGHRNAAGFRVGWDHPLAVATPFKKG